MPLRIYSFQQNKNAPILELDFATVCEYFQSKIIFEKKSLLDGKPFMPLVGKLSSGLENLKYKAWANGKWQDVTFYELRDLHLEGKVDFIWNDLICNDNHGVAFSMIPQLERKLLRTVDNEEEYHLQVKRISSLLSKSIELKRTLYGGDLDDLNDDEELVLNPSMAKLLQKLLKILTTQPLKFVHSQQILPQHNSKKPKLKSRKRQNKGRRPNSKSPYDHLRSTQYVPDDFEVGANFEILYRGLWTKVLVLKKTGLEIDFRLLSTGQILSCELKPALNEKFRRKGRPLREVGKKSRKSVKRRKPVIPQSSVKKRKLERVPPELMEVPPPEEKIAESILGDRWNANHGEHEFLVKWKRRNLSEASWELLRDVSPSDICNQYRYQMQGVISRKTKKCHICSEKSPSGLYYLSKTLDLKMVCETCRKSIPRIESEHSMPSKTKPVTPEVIDMSKPSPPPTKPMSPMNPGPVSDQASPMQNREPTPPIIPAKEHSELQMIDTESAMSIDSAAADFDMKPDAPVASPSPDISDEEAADNSLPSPKMKTTVVNPLRKRLTPVAEKLTPEKRLPDVAPTRSRESKIASFVSKFNIGDGCEVFLNQLWKKGTVTVIDPTFVEIKVFGESRITRVSLKDIKKRLRLSSKYKGLLWDREANRFRAFIELKIPAKETVEVELSNAQTQEEMAALLRKEAYEFLNKGRLSEGDASGYGVLRIEPSQIAHVT